MLTPTPPPAWVQRAGEHERRLESTLPRGTRVYVLQMMHVHDPIKRIDIDFPADSLVIRNKNEIVISELERGTWTFSSAALLTRDPSDVQIFFYRPGEAPDLFVLAHARLDHVIK